MCWREDKICSICISQKEQLDTGKGWPLVVPEVKKAGTEQIKKKAKSSIIEQLSRKKKEMAEREVSRTIPEKSKKQDMEL